MKWGWLFVASALILKGQELELPEWNKDELEALESGNLVPGSSLLGQMAQDYLLSESDVLIGLDPSVRDLPEEDILDDELWVSSIDPTFVDTYFRTRPESFLVDPQQLLTTQEFRDREGFLNYHARDTEIDFYFYLFDARQELPEEESVQQVVDDFFQGTKAVAVVFYYLGMPERTRIGFSQKVRESVVAEELDKILKMSVEKALEKSDPTSQIDSFSVQFSVRLYWLEKMVSRNRFDGSTLDSGMLLDLEMVSEGDSGFFARLKENPLMLYGFIVVGVLIPATLLGFLGRYYAERKREYIFPDAQGSPLLGAPHAAGVGGVISYLSVSLPPSSQREEVPNYLTRM
ncbi:MAG: hypothetical protein QNL33_03970 [Akkermansiaceae bacterium]|jgi:hypothetical protein